MTNLPNPLSCVTAVLGLGYVGLPLALALSSRSAIDGQTPITIGFDLNQRRIEELQNNLDVTNETTAESLASSNILYTCSDSDLQVADFFIITVPTPIDNANQPDLLPLCTATSTVAKQLSTRDPSRPKPIIVYESTVFPGATEEVCVPLLEQLSGLTHNKDFFTGYSPERINPGDKSHGLKSIVKVTSGSTPEVSSLVSTFYASFITAGVHQAPSIQVAEAAKVLENTQRDVNIALINELAVILSRLGIDTHDVLAAARTKWNFLDFQPGLVGGHCIGVDPYYLTHKAQSVGYHPEVMLSGRRINDSMASWYVDKVILNMASKQISTVGSSALVLGLTFKEDCPDIRNSKVIDLVLKLVDYGVTVTVVEPWLDSLAIPSSLPVECRPDIPFHQTYNIIILAVPHREFLSHSLYNWHQLLKPNTILFDLKSVLPRSLNPVRF